MVVDPDIDVMTEPLDVSALGLAGGEDDPVDVLTETLLELAAFRREPHRHDEDTMPPGAGGGDEGMPKPGIGGVRPVVVERDQHRSADRPEPVRSTMLCSRRLRAGVKQTTYPPG
jgi:hypothetical protein